MLMTKSDKELLIQKEIAVTLNQCIDMYEMLEVSLKKLLELMELQTGWIFLTNEASDYELAAYQNLPPVFLDDNFNRLTCSSGCYDCACLQLYWEGYLPNAVNSIKCVRLEEAILENAGDTRNLKFHASIPLTIRGRKLGLLNLASLEKKRFDQKELLLLESIAYQIGTAAERIQLYEAQKKQEVDSIARYLVDYYKDMDRLNRQLEKASTRQGLYKMIIEELSSHFKFWPKIALLTKENNELLLRAITHAQHTKMLTEQPFAPLPSIIQKAYYEKSISQSYQQSLNYSSLETWENCYSIALPLETNERQSHALGVLLISRESEAFTDLEIEMLEVLAGLLSMAIEKTYLQEEWEALLVEKERNRLARDLHDAVNQKLFALALTARGLQQITTDSKDMVTEAISDIQKLSQDALSEMRSLIWQLRPQELDKEIATSIQEYGSKLGLQLEIHALENIMLSDKKEQALWRIAQEALNNIKKHAKTNDGIVHITKTSSFIEMKISDHGCGGASEKQHSIGMKSMRERAKEINAKITIESIKGKGTSITVTVPMHNEEEN